MTCEIFEGHAPAPKKGEKIVQAETRETSGGQKGMMGTDQKTWEPNQESHFGNQKGKMEKFKKDMTQRTAVTAETNTPVSSGQ